MSKRQIIMLCGAVVALIPFIGLRDEWDTVLSVVIGVIIIGIAYRMSPVSTVLSSTPSNQDKTPSLAVPFVEHTTAPVVEVKEEPKVEVN